MPCLEGDVVSKVARSRVVGPLADYADGFRSTLAGMGYTLASAEIHVWLMGRLSRWLLAEGLQPGEAGAPEVVRFLAVHGAGRSRVPTEWTLRRCWAICAPWVWCRGRRCRIR